MSFEKGALSLLAAYGDNSSDDDVPSCHVSTKRELKDSSEGNTKKRKKLPVPEVISNLGNITDTYVDEPSMHEGRSRSFPHERGNWATYVFIPYESNFSLEDFISSIRTTVTHLDLKLIDHYHISVTKTVILRHHWIDSFMQTVKDNTKHIGSFAVVFDHLKVYCNEERTRTFLGIHVKSGYDALTHLVKIMDSCLSEFNLPCFYSDPSFHMSLLWCMGDQEIALNGILPTLNDNLIKCMNDFSGDNWYFYVNNLQCKTGNKIFNFNLL